MSREHAHISRLLIDYHLGTLTVADATRVQRHLEGCTRCRMALEDIAELVGCLQRGKGVAADEHDLGSARAALFEAVAREEGSIRSGRSLWSFRWRELFQLRPLGYSLASLALAALIGVLLFAGRQDPDAVAWGCLMENVERARSYSYQQHTTIAGRRQAVLKGSAAVSYRRDSGLRIDSRWHDPDGNKVMADSMYFVNSSVIQVFEDQKKYVRGFFTEPQWMEIRRQNNPSAMVREILSYPYRELGTATINGVSAAGIEVTDTGFGRGRHERCAVRLWADTKTDLPVQIEIEGVADRGGIRTTMRLDGFDWNAELPPKHFVPDIARGYVLAADVNSSDDEKTALQSLSRFAEVSGRYPESLAWISLYAEIDRVLAEKGLPGAHSRESARQDIEKSYGVRAASLFYARLDKNNADAAYYGAKVAPGDVFLPLLRWRVTDGTYRVIYGDLRAQDVSAVRLAELEAAL